MKKAVVIHSGGMDSSICLALAIKEYGVKNVLSLSFSYQQRHSEELIQAKKICFEWGVDHVVLPLPALHQITDSALTNPDTPIEHQSGSPPNTMVIGRNGLMAHLGGIYAHHLGAHCIYMGIIEVESNNSGYRDCSRAYMDLKEQTLRMDLGEPNFEIKTPLVFMTKKETLDVAERLGVLSYLLEETITCYEGVRREGCKKCPACLLRNEGLRQYKLAQEKQD